MERPIKVINGKTYKQIDGFDHTYWIGLDGIYSDQSKHFLKESRKSTYYDDDGREYHSNGGHVQLSKKGSGYAGKDVNVNDLYRKYFGTSREEDKKK